MTYLKKLLLVPMIAGSLMLTGCGDGENHDGHNHDGHNHEVHSEDDGHGHSEENGDGHGAEHELGEVTIAETVLQVAFGGEPAPNAALHINIQHSSGPKPSTIRVWVSDDSGIVFTSKSKATGSGSYHADATCPSELPKNAMLWIEIQSADGTRVSQSLSLSLDAE